MCSCAQVADAELDLARRAPQEVSFERSEEQALEKGLSRPASLTCLFLSPRHASGAVSGSTHIEVSSRATTCRRRGSSRNATEDGPDEPSPAFDVVRSFARISQAKRASMRGLQRSRAAKKSKVSRVCQQSLSSSPEVNGCSAIYLRSRGPGGLQMHSST